MDVECRRKSLLELTFNKRRFTHVLVDPHYEKNHPDITDQIIMKLLKLLDGTELDPVDENGEFKYFAKTLI